MHFKSKVHAHLVQSICAFSAMYMHFWCRVCENFNFSAKCTFSAKYFYISISKCSFSAKYFFNAKCFFRVRVLLVHSALLVLNALSVQSALIVQSVLLLQSA